MILEILWWAYLFWMAKNKKFKTFRFLFLCLNNFNLVYLSRLNHGEKFKDQFQSLLIVLKSQVEIILKFKNKRNSRSNEESTWPNLDRSGCNREQVLNLYAVCFTKKMKESFICGVNVFEFIWIQFLSHFIIFYTNSDYVVLQWVL
jgi:hypothetical protein